jgi:hypothetical protein
VRSHNASGPVFVLRQVVARERDIETDQPAIHTPAGRLRSRRGGEFKKIFDGRELLVGAAEGRTCNLNTVNNVDFVDALKGLSPDGKDVAKQYR